jgi:hypothetical protein
MHFTFTFYYILIDPNTVIHTAAFYHYTISTRILTILYSVLSYPFLNSDFISECHLHIKI